MEGIFRGRETDLVERLVKLKSGWELISLERLYELYTYTESEGGL